MKNQLREAEALNSELEEKCNNRSINPEAGTSGVEKNLVKVRKSENVLKLVKNSKDRTNLENICSDFLEWKICVWWASGRATRFIRATVCSTNAVPVMERSEGRYHAGSKGLAQHQLTGQETLFGVLSGTI